MRTLLALLLLSASPLLSLGQPKETNTSKIVRISVPSYIIFDRQGKIAERHAKRPSNGEELKKELSGYLR